MSDDEELTPAATVLLLRDGDDGLEVLMLRRNSTIAFGGMWVFPGGRVDDHELVAGDPLAAARVAAVREVEEETGLTVAADSLETWSYWIPPTRAALQPGAKLRRFSTWFFAAPTPGHAIAIDGGEIHEHRWLPPAQAMELRQQGEIELVPPTWVTLWQLARHGTVAEAMAWAAATEPEEFRTRPIGREPMTLAWFGDAGYDAGGHDAEGPRHRLVMEPAGWVYHRHGV
ncbi:MAG: NUDIX domain-containing protein [Acidimicrobiales bacterium]